MCVLANILMLGLLAGCGEPIKGVDDDARAAKAQARDAVNAAEEAARRIEESSRPVPADPAKDPQQN
jgi:hypothetical protein